MRLPVNLASEPMRHDRPILIASTAVGILLCATLAMLIGLGISDSRNMEESRARIAGVQAQLAKITAAQAQVDAQMRLPENSSVLGRSVLFNDLIRAKAVSWTKIFSDLETVLPHDVRIIAIRPQLNGRNQLSLDMTVAALTPDPVTGFLMKLESTDMFGDETVSAETPPTQNDPYYRYRLTVTYDQKL
jgi:Tfp pilus assembly protein PilN